MENAVPTLSYPQQLLHKDNYRDFGLIVKEPNGYEAVLYANAGILSSWTAYLHGPVTNPQLPSYELKKYDCRSEKASAIVALLLWLDKQDVFVPIGGKTYTELERLLRIGIQDISDLAEIADRWYVPSLRVDLVNLIEKAQYGCNRLDYATLFLKSIDSAAVLFLSEPQLRKILGFAFNAGFTIDIAERELGTISLPFKLLIYKEAYNKSTEIVYSLTRGENNDACDDACSKRTSADKTPCTTHTAKKRLRDRMKSVDDPQHFGKRLHLGD